jgi:hypothetical protein
MGGFETVLLIMGFVFGVVAVGILTDKTHIKPAAKRAKIAEDFLDRLDQGGPR